MMGLGTKRWVFFCMMAVVAAASVAGCGSDNGVGDGDGGIDGAPPGDGDPPTDGDPTDCVPQGGECATTAECCGGRLCEADGSGVRRCTDETFCKGTGTACERASECCSLSCDGTCQGDGSLCSPVGTGCTSDSQCCSNDCDGTCQSIGEHCAPMGELCSSEGYDDDCCSKNCQNLGTTDDPDLRCARASSCGARGEICAVNADCCSGVCIDGRCPTQNEIGQKNFAGEPCQVDADCASYLCASDYPGGPTVCQFLGGCRPTGEICTADWQCCSDIHYTGTSCPESYDEGVGCVEHHEVDGLWWCAGMNAQTGPKEPGELCGDSAGDEVHECCFGCEETPVGVWRCEGGGDVCVPDDEPCRASADCCSGICSPFLVDETCDVTEEECEVQLRCGQCVPTGGLCTSHADCCNFTCVDGVCGDQEDPECIPVGAPCEDGDTCCDDRAICLDVCQIVG